MTRLTAAGTACILVALVACGSTDAPSPGGATPLSAAPLVHAKSCNGPAKPSAPGIDPSSAGGHTVPHGFAIETIAQISQPRELAALPDGDLLVATESNTVYIVPNAESPRGKPAGAPRVFATIPDKQAAGIAFAAPICTVYYGTTGGVWASAYHGGDLRADRIAEIARVRTGGIPPSSDGDVHTTTSVAYAGGMVYASVGSSCNACTEIDPTRASILEMDPNGAHVTKRATRIRNGIAIFTDPATQALWVGGAGQDDLPFGHPYEYIDDVSAHRGVADYGWPECEENHRAYEAGANCSSTVEPIVELPAYSTIIGATFYPADQSGAYAFPPRYRGGIFAAAHGSWHTTPSGTSAAAAQVVFVPMSGDRPATPVNWKDPSTQWTLFGGGYQLAGTSRDGRPTGIAVGPEGTLFIADGDNDLIYRVRPR